MDPQLEPILTEAVESGGLLVVLTGAGISAESGIPTFRGEEGYWTIGSREYHSQEMATQAMFQRRPEEVWRWYLYRRGVCRNAQVNSAHRALARLERVFRDRFLLVTQNVDGLHLRAGNTIARTYQIHGNIDYVRCSRPCHDGVVSISGEIGAKGRADLLSDRDCELLHCTQCGAWMRPHVLWFDEYYDEKHYRFESSLEAATLASLLIVVGTSGSTNLPMQMGYLVARRRSALIDINIKPTPFSRLARDNDRGMFVPSRATEALPEMVDFLVSIAEPSAPETTTSV